MARQERPTFMIEDAELIFKNFAGNAGKFNAKGIRSFAVILPDEDAQKMIADGWNVKFLNPREEGDEPVPYISVAVKFDIRPPKVVLISSRARTNLDEESIEVLDYTSIGVADLIAQAYDWTMPDGKNGRKAYLQSLYITVEEDALDRKYSQVETSDND